MNPDSILCKLPENLYTPGAPVVISSAVLREDETTGQATAVLAFRNISDQMILSLTARLQPRDENGDPLGEALAYTYQDLHLGRNEETGWKERRELPDSETQSFSVLVDQVVFADNSTWKNERESWEPLRTGIPAAHVYSDQELLKQYALTFGENSAYIYREDKGLWSCACGTINRAEEPACWKCGAKAAQLKNLDWRVLHGEKTARLQKEKADREAAEKKAAEEEAARLAAEKAEAERKAAEWARKKKILIEKGLKAAAVLAVVLVIGAGLGSYIRQQKHLKDTYVYALALLELDQYDEAKETFLSIADYKDSAQQAENVDAVRLEDAYDNACRLQNRKEYVQAAEIFTQLGDYRDSREQATECVYQHSRTLLEDLKYADALEEFQALGNYKDSAEIVETLLASNPLIFLEPGETVTFGTFEQDNDRRNGKEAIEWIVLAKEEKRILLLSKYALDSREFHTGWKGAAWDASSIRRWLNGVFYNGAFVYAEKIQILQTELTNPQNPEYETSSGKDTKDRIFLLSLEEFETCFTPGIPRTVEFTPYAVAEHERKDTWGISGEGWWLRTIGSEAFRPVYVWKDGEVVNNLDNFACNAMLAVRPAMWVTLS